MSVLAFTILALALTGPVPALLARASWPLRAPRAAVVLWQAVALAAVLSAFSAGLSVVALHYAPVPTSFLMMLMKEFTVRGSMEYPERFADAVDLLAKLKKDAP